ncbi:exocyst complex component Sec10-like protein, partial [Fimicolochytrium jonesii]|uniref:exocyst complex component Sec10-like protein n=1 Tax=Fimicolochytrium jonesii TaxID=1396493 RepID=UPI0022FE2228
MGFPDRLQKGVPPDLKHTRKQHMHRDRDMATRQRSGSTAKGGLSKVGTGDSQSPRELVKLENFKGKFAPIEFVESLSSKLLTQNQATPRQFDPKPFIRNFEAAIDELLRLKRKIHNKIEDLEDQAEASESARRKSLHEIDEAMQEAHVSFESLESRLGNVGKTAISIGEQLETIDKQRQRAAEAKDLIQYFAEFNAGNTRRLDDVKDEGAEGEFKTATIVRRLSAVAKEVDIPGTEAARSNIESYAEHFEKELLERFDDAYRDFDRRVMNECACALVEFNGGESCIRAYVNQHEFFMNRAKVKELEVVDDLPREQADLVALCDEVRKTCKEEWAVIRAVFPNPQTVMQQFIQRIFAQSIQTQLENVVSLGNEESHLAYLRALSTSHQTISALANDLHKLDESIVADKGGKPMLTSAINRSFDDLFVPHIEGDKYIEAEQYCLTELFNESLGKFYEYTIQRSKTARGKPVTKSSTSSAAPPSPTKLSPTSAEAIMSKFVTTMNVLGQEVAQTIGLQPASERMSPEEMGLPSVQMMTGLLELHVEAMARCGQLTKMSDMAANGSTLFKLFVETVGVKYLAVALDMMIEDLQYSDPRLPPTFEQLPMVQVAQKVLQLLQFHFQSSIAPVVSASPTAHRDMVVYKNSFMSTVEHRLNVLVQKQITAIVGWLGTLLGTQKKTDFKPKDDAGDQEILPSPTCIQVCDFLSLVHQRGGTCLAGSNLENFLSEIGISFQSLLLDHLKKFTVSQAGGLILLTDMAAYQHSITTLSIPLLSERFDMLRELANLFVVRPENLKTVMNEGHLSRIEMQLLHPFLSMRADWGRLKGLEKDLFTGGARAGRGQEA